MTANHEENGRSSPFGMNQNDLDSVTELEHFEDTDAPAHSKGKTRLPDAEQAKVTHYAYDPKTYEILCRAGQRLSQRKAQRLQELSLYAHVVTCAE